MNIRIPEGKKSLIHPRENDALIPTFALSLHNPVVIKKTLPEIMLKTNKRTNAFAGVSNKNEAQYICGMIAIPYNINNNKM